MPNQARIGFVKTFANIGDRIRVYFDNGRSASYVAGNNITSAKVVVLGSQVFSEDVQSIALNLTNKLFKSKASSVEDGIYPFVSVYVVNGIDGAILYSIFNGEISRIGNVPNDFGQIIDAHFIGLNNKTINGSVLSAGNKYLVLLEESEITNILDLNAIFAADVLDLIYRGNVAYFTGAFNLLLPVYIPTNPPANITVINEINKIGEVYTGSSVAKNPYNINYSETKTILSNPPSFTAISINSSIIVVNDITGENVPQGAISLVNSNYFRATFDVTQERTATIDRNIDLTHDWLYENEYLYPIAGDAIVTNPVPKKRYISSGETINDYSYDFESTSTDRKYTTTPLDPPFNTAYNHVREFNETGSLVENKNFHYESYLTIETDVILSDFYKATAIKSEDIFEDETSSKTYNYTYYHYVEVIAGSDNINTEERNVTNYLATRETEFLRNELDLNFFSLFNIGIVGFYKETKKEEITSDVFSLNRPAATGFNEYFYDFKRINQDNNIGHQNSTYQNRLSQDYSFYKLVFEANSPVDIRPGFARKCQLQSGSQSILASAIASGIDPINASIIVDMKIGNSDTAIAIIDRQSFTKTLSEEGLSTGFTNTKVDLEPFDTRGLDIFIGQEVVLQAAIFTDRYLIHGTITQITDTVTNFSNQSSSSNTRTINTVAIATTKVQLLKNSNFFLSGDFLFSVDGAEFFDFVRHDNSLKEYGNRKLNLITDDTPGEPIKYYLALTLPLIQEEETTAMVFELLPENIVYKGLVEGTLSDFGIDSQPNRFTKYYYLPGIRSLINSL